MAKDGARRGVACRSVPPGQKDQRPTARNEDDAYVESTNIPPDYYHRVVFITFSYVMRFIYVRCSVVAGLSQFNKTPDATGGPSAAGGACVRSSFAKHFAALLRTFSSVQFSSVLLVDSVSRATRRRGGTAGPRGFPAEPHAGPGEGRRAAAVQGGATAGDGPLLPRGLREDGRNPARAEGQVLLQDADHPPLRAPGRKLRPSQGQAGARDGRRGGRGGGTWGVSLQPHPSAVTSPGPHCPAGPRLQGNRPEPGALQDSVSPCSPSAGLRLPPGAAALLLPSLVTRPLHPEARPVVAPPSWSVCFQLTFGWGATGLGGGKRATGTRCVRQA